jgi:glucosamine--fructose-6-phosphate aminotransferase (isomerizing)
MCGIVAYIGRRQATDILLEGLKRLEYRGYDSAGVAVMNGGLHLARAVGRVANVEKAIDDRGGFKGTLGIAHPPCLSVKHIEGEPLILHAQIEEFGVIHPNHALIKIRRSQTVGRFQAQIIGQEGEVVLVAGAHDNRIDLF